MKKYVVRLPEEEREQLRALVKKGRGAAYRIKHANILLQADADGPCRTDAEIAETLSCHARTVENVRRRFVVDGLEAALERKRQARPSRERKLDGAGEARLIAVSCSEAPGERDRWTLSLLGAELVRLGVVESISKQTVMRTLKKTNYSRTARSTG